MDLRINQMPLSLIPFRWEHFFQRERLTIFLLCSVAIIWWLSFLGNGLNDYGDGMLYASHAASLSRTFHTEPSFKLDPDKGAAKSRNIGYELLLAVVHKIVGKSRLWYGCAVSFSFYLIGVFFFLRIVINLTASKWIVIVSILFFAISPIGSGVSVRPLADVPYFGICMFILWFQYRHPSRPIVTGMLLGFLIFMRIFGYIWILPVLFLLIDKFSIRKNLHTFGLVLLGLIPFIILKSIVNAEVNPSQISEGLGIKSTYYVHFLLGRLDSVGFEFLFSRFFQNCQQLVNYTDLTFFVIVLFVAVFDRHENKFITKLRWATFLGIFQVVVISALQTQMTTRRLFPFMLLTMFLSIHYIYEKSKYFVWAWRVGMPVLIGIMILYFPFAHYKMLFKDSFEEKLAPDFGQNRPSPLPRNPIEVYRWEKLERLLVPFGDSLTVATNYPQQVNLLIPTKKIIQMWPPNRQEKGISPSWDNFVKYQNKHNVDLLVWIFNKRAYHRTASGWDGAFPTKLNSKKMRIGEQSYQAVFFDESPYVIIRVFASEGFSSKFSHSISANEDVLFSHGRHKTGYDKFFELVGNPIGYWLFDSYNIVNLFRLSKMGDMYFENGVYPLFRPVSDGFIDRQRGDLDLNNFTLCLWVNILKLPGVDVPVETLLFGATNLDFGITIYKNEIWGYFGGGGSGIKSKTKIAMEESEWYFLTLVKDQKALSLYIDGEEVQKAIAVTPNVRLNSKIGCNLIKSSRSETASFKLASVALWENSLSSESIKTLYYLQRGKPSLSQQVNSVIKTSVKSMVYSGGLP